MHADGFALASSGVEWAIILIIGRNSVIISTRRTSAKLVFAWMSMEKNFFRKE